MTISMTVKGVPKVIKFLKQKKNKVDDEITNSMKQSGQQMQNEVKASIAGQKAEPASVDTGKFLNSVDFNYSKKTFNVFSPLSYAKFLEYGTSKIAARRHFGNSIDRNKNIIKNILEGNIKKI